MLHHWQAVENRGSLHRPMGSYPVACLVVAYLVVACRIVAVERVLELLRSRHVFGVGNSQAWVRWWVRRVGLA